MSSNENNPESSTGSSTGNVQRLKGLFGKAADAASSTASSVATKGKAAAKKGKAAVSAAVPVSVTNAASSAAASAKGFAAKATDAVSSGVAKAKDAAHRATGYRDYYDMAESSTKYYDSKEIREKCKKREAMILDNEDLKPLINDYKAKDKKKEDNTENINKIKNILNTSRNSITDLYFLDCTSGKLLKYLIRLELKAYKKCVKERGDEKCKKSEMLKIVKLTNNRFVLDTAYLLNQIQDLNGKFNKLKVEINKVKTPTKTNLSDADLKKIIKSLIEVKQLNDIIDDNPQAGGGCRAEANEYYMMGMLLLIVGIGIFFIFMGALTDMACDFAPKSMRGGYKNNKLYSLDYAVNITNLRGGMSFDEILNSKDEIISIEGMINGLNSVIEIFNNFKEDVTLLQKFKDIKKGTENLPTKKLEKVCTFSNPDICFESRKNLDFIKNLLKSIDQAYDRYDTEETKPAESGEAASGEGVSREGVSGEGTN